MRTEVGFVSLEVQWKRHLNNDNRAEMFPRPILCVIAMA